MRRRLISVAGAAVAVIGGLWFAMQSSTTADQVATRERLQTLFDTRPGTLTVGPPAIFNLPPIDAVEVLPVRYEPPEGEGFMAVSFRCGLVITLPGQEPQAVVTVGTGSTEVLSCDGLTAIDVVAGKVPMIGTIYRFRSPNVTFPGPVIVRWDEPSKRFVVDDAMGEALDATGPVETMDALKLTLPKL
ncbi:MAG: hypothetical protein AAF666_08620 [Pseudomonadota bacterium]